MKKILLTFLTFLGLVTTVSTTIKAEESFDIIQNFDYSEDGYGTIGQNNPYFIYQVSTSGNANQVLEISTDGILKFGTSGSPDADGLYQLHFRKDKGNTGNLFNKSGEDLVIKTKFKTEDNYTKSIQIYDGSYSGVELGATTLKTLTADTWHDIVIVVSCKTKKAYLYADNVLLESNDVANYAGSLTNIRFQLSKAKFAREEYFYIDYLKIGTYGPATATVDSTKTVEAGSTFTLNPTLSNADASIPAYNVEITDSSVLSYSNGTFTALSAGTTTVTYNFVDELISDVTSTITVEGETVVDTHIFSQEFNYSSSGLGEIGYDNDYTISEALFTKASGYTGDATAEFGLAQVDGVDALHVKTLSGAEGYSKVTIRESSAAGSLFNQSGKDAVINVRMKTSLYTGLRIFLISYNDTTGKNENPYIQIPSSFGNGWFEFKVIISGNVAYLYSGETLISQTSINWYGKLSGVFFQLGWTDTVFTKEENLYIDYIRVDEYELPQLDTPVVSISNEGIASWNEVANATSYAYSINGGDPIVTTERSVSLTDGQTIKVYAISDDANYSNSDYSEAQTYYGLLCQYNDEGTKLRFIGVIKNYDLSSIEKIEITLTLNGKTANVSTGDTVYTRVISGDDVLFNNFAGTYYSVLVLTGIEDYVGEKMTATLVITMTDGSTVKYSTKTINILSD